ncbi:hypothetical protein OC844_005355 [Tilletia horrida]|nr:hypothetical protein OC844_005355 [Tilletia horrida]
MAVAANCYSRHSFAGLPKPPEGDQLDNSFDPGVIRVFEWSLNPTQECVRLTLAHYGALFHFYLSGSDPFGRPILDAITGSWSIPIDGDDSEDEGSWYDYPYRSELKYSAAVLSCEARLLRVALDALCQIVKEFNGKNGPSVNGAQLLIEVKTSPPSTQPEAILVGDLYCDIFMDDRLTLQDADFPDVPRIDRGAITAYVLRKMSDQAFVVQLDRLDDEYLSSMMFFKTHRSPSRAANWPAVRCNVQELFLDELKTMIETPFHPNVIPSPRALITLTEDKVGAGIPSGRVTKLVGWVQSGYSPVRASYRDDDESATAWRYLGFARDLCHGVLHLAQHGFVHPDLSCDNLLMASATDDASATEDRLLVADLEKITFYINKDGPSAPEALGLWTAHLDARGALQYQRCNQADPTPRLDGIYDELAGMPEARERLLMYSLGCTLTQLLDLRLTFTGVDLSGLPGMVRRVCLSTAVQPGQDPKRDAWEAYFPAEVRRMAQRCVAEDPRQRPLLDDIVKTMDEALHYFTA